MNSSGGTFANSVPVSGCTGVATSARAGIGSATGSGSDPRAKAVMALVYWVAAVAVAAEGGRGKGAQRPTVPEPEGGEM